MVEDSLKDATKEADREKDLKDVVEATVKDKGKAIKDVEKRAREAKKAQALTEQKLTEMDVKLGENRAQVG